MSDKLSIKPLPFREETLCDCYQVNGEPTTTALLELLSELEDQNPDRRYLFTLDDYGQACYTSAHASMSHDLNEVEGHDLSGLPDSCFENGEHLGYLSTIEEFFIRKVNCEKLLEKTSFEDICARGVSLFNADRPEDIPAFEFDLVALLDRKFYLLSIPVTKPYETFYAFPNGYFTCDLNPGENALLAKLLYEKFSYELIGVGASYLAYRKQRELNNTEKTELIDMLDNIYCNDFDTGLRSKIEETLSQEPVLILKYTE